MISIKIQLCHAEAPKRQKKTKKRKIDNVGTTPLLLFVNIGSGGDLREAHGSRDVPIFPDEGEPERNGEKNEMSKVRRSDNRLHDGRTSRSNVPFDSSQPF